MLIIVFVVTARGESPSSLLMDVCVVVKSGYSLPTRDRVDIPKWSDVYERFGFRLERDWNDVKT